MVKICDFTKNFRTRWYKIPKKWAPHSRQFQCTYVQLKPKQKMRASIQTVWLTVYQSLERNSFLSRAIKLTFNLTRINEIVLVKPAQIGKTPETGNTEGKA